MLKLDNVVDYIQIMHYKVDRAEVRYDNSESPRLAPTAGWARKNERPLPQIFDPEGQRPCNWHFSLRPQLLKQRTALNQLPRDLAP